MKTVGGETGGDGLPVSFDRNICLFEAAIQIHGRPDMA